MSFKAIKIKNCKIPEENTLLDNFWKDFAQTGHSGGRECVGMVVSWNDHVFFKGGGGCQKTTYVHNKGGGSNNLKFLTMWFVDGPLCT